MRKYLFFMFLIILILFSLFHEIKAMEECSDETIVATNSATRVYLVSPEENAQPLSNKALREKYPLYAVIHYDDLDRQLYLTRRDSKKLKYNPEGKVQEALIKLKQFAKKGSGPRLKIEKDALPHLFLAATSLLEGTNGMRKNRELGAEFMQLYLEEIHRDVLGMIRVDLGRLSKDPNYQVRAFIGEFQKIKMNFSRVLDNLFTIPRKLEK